MALDNDYRWAARRLHDAGFPAVAERMMVGRRRGPDQTPMCVAVMAAVDAVDCRRAAALDPVNADRWQAIAKDQAHVSATALALLRAGEVAG